MDVDQTNGVGTDTAGLKKCRKCDQFKLLEEFWRSQGRCIYCICGKTRADINDAKRRREHQRLSWAHKSKTCNTCKQEKLWSEFPIRHRRGRDTAADRCKQCSKERLKEFHDMLNRVTRTLHRFVDNCGVEQLVLPGAKTEQERKDQELYIAWCEKNMV
jgi:hypothetical protein